VKSAIRPANQLTPRWWVGGGWAIHHKVTMPRLSVPSPLSRHFGSGRRSGHVNTAPLGRDPSSVGLVIGLLVSATAAGLVLTANDTWAQVLSDPVGLVAFLGATVVLQLVAAELYGRGSLSAADVGMLAIGFAFGPGPGMLAAVVMAAVHAAKRRTRPHRALFNAAMWALATGAATGAYHAVSPAESGTAALLALSVAAGALFGAINVGLLTLVMSLSERVEPMSVWRERFRWMTPSYLAAGLIAAATMIAYERVGLVGLVAFALPPALLAFSQRQYLARTRASVEEVRRANEELRRTNAELAVRNQDLRQLLDFAEGLGARAHDETAVVAYAEESLGRLTGAHTRISRKVEEGGLALVSGTTPVGTLHFQRTPTFDADRWARLREALLPQLATAIERASLVEEVRKKHLATIAALSRSMEAKDYYTGGHTERVSSVAVAVARRLGCSSEELDAIEIGALLHDIGKIGIPEHILRKPGPLNDEEWQVVKRHPLISEFILADIDLPATVLQIARSSHERVDGGGYPDGLAGDDIPLPARIVLVADALDALTSDRPYRKGRSLDAAMSEMRANAGKQFCPTVIRALEEVYRDEPQALGAPDLRVVGVA
jgi:HD-GYP domain-containing protein (c-di-GMP phosphodiesterase class II)